jgi:adenosylcobinamide-phosphate synthase
VLPSSDRVRPVILAVALDLCFGEPPNRWHPVAWIGSLASLLERAAPGQGRFRRLLYGAALGLFLPTLAGTAGLLAQALAVRLPSAAALLMEALALKASFSLSPLFRVAGEVSSRLERGAEAEAREGLRALVSRPLSGLSQSDLVSAAIESVAENVSDSFVAPILYYQVAGLPGAFSYRAVNTLDAMIGYHGDYEDLGKAAARLDDLANLLPARVSALLLVGAAWLGFGDGRCAWSRLLRERGRTESPNAGWPMAATAGALRVRLAKPGHYWLGDSLPDPRPGDIDRAIRLCCIAAGLALVSFTLVEGVRGNIARADAL